MSDSLTFVPTISVAAATALLQRMASADILQRTPWDVEPSEIARAAEVVFPDAPKARDVAVARVQAFRRVMADGSIDEFIKPGIPRGLSDAICAAVALCPLLVDELATFDAEQFRDQIMLMAAIEGVN